MRLKIYFLFFFILFSLTLTYPEDNSRLSLINGSNIYMRIFLFFFPITSTYESYSTIEESTLISEITIKKDTIKNEPSTPPLFDTDFTIRIKDIPLKSGNYTLNVTLRCNRKVNFKDVNFTVLKKNNLLILKGYINNLLLNEISDNDYFKKRLKWKYPLYFDLRYNIE
jgi:hypothetical protein